MVSHKLPLFCPVCNTYTKELLQDKITESLIVHYRICPDCGLVHSFDHSFFETILYIDNYFEDIDSEWKDRSDQIFSILDRHLLNKKPLKILDIGAGTNYLAHRLAQAGYDAYGFDAYSEPIYAKDRFFNHLQSLTPLEFDIITLFEVMEHLVHPLENLRLFFEFLKPSGQIMFSTVLYNQKQHKSVDWYINPRFGHVTIWSMDALYHVFSEFKFKSAIMFRMGNIQIWSRLPGTFITGWSVQKSIGQVRSYLGRMRYLLRRK